MNSSLLMRYAASFLSDNYALKIGLRFFLDLTSPYYADKFDPISPSYVSPDVAKKTAF